ncbi:MAG: sorting protein [Capsulimonas sp.]|nr:sorting protein [Capsulimonas sp.]
MATGSPSYFGGGSGDLASGISISDTAFYNEFTQSFQSGDSPGGLLTFTLSTTTAPDAGAPDEFSFYLLDSSGNVVLTSDSYANSLMTIDLNSAIPNVTTYQGAGDYQGLDITVTPLAAVPEPSSVASLGLLLLMTGGAMWRLRRKSRFSIAGTTFGAALRNAQGKLEAA